MIQNQNPVSSFKNSNNMALFHNRYVFAIFVVLLVAESSSILVSERRDVLGRTRRSVDPNRESQSSSSFWRVVREQMRLDNGVEESQHKSCIMLCNKYEVEDGLSLKRRFCTTAVYQFTETIPSFVTDEATWRNSCESIGSCEKFNLHVKPCCTWLLNQDQAMKNQLCPESELENSIIAKSYDYKMQKNAAESQRKRGAAEQDSSAAACNPSTNLDNSGMPCVVSL
jgi:hypothetical protein